MFEELFRGGGLVSDLEVYDGFEVGREVEVDDGFGGGEGLLEVGGEHVEGGGEEWKVEFARREFFGHEEGGGGGRNKEVVN